MTFEVVKGVLRCYSVALFTPRLLLSVAAQEEREPRAAENVNATRLFLTFGG
jgi:hypothetical protein